MSPGLWQLFLATILFLGCCSLPANAASAKVMKVLPHLLDREGRHSLSPSLYERDAYQVRLRLHPELRAGLRFDVHWKAQLFSEMKMRVEMRGAHGKDPTTATVEKQVKRRRIFNQWSALLLEGEDYKKFGDLIAWRVTLWDGDTMIAEQQSFLW